MGSAKSSGSYRWLAEYYDEFFTAHLPWYRAARESALAPVLPNIKSACDLACGTGTTAIELARAGIRVSAVDLSPVMCRLARQKLKRAGLKMRVIRADMRSLRLPEPVDLILCEFDALNHLPDAADLAGTLAAVERNLRPGGFFYFDVNNRLAFQAMWPGVWRFERPGVAMTMSGGYDATLDKGWTDADWFIRDGKCWHRKRERIEQVCWDANEIRRELRAAGFRQVRAWDAVEFFKGHPDIRPGCRTFYLARKV